jgi:hypothetical protein
MGKILVAFPDFESASNEEVDTDLESNEPQEETPPAGSD